MRVKRKTRERFWQKFEYRRNKLAKEIINQSQRSLVESIKRISDMAKLNMYVEVANQLAKKKWINKSPEWIQDIHSKAYLAKHITLLRIYELYSRLVEVSLEVDCLVFRYQVRGFQQTRHFPLDNLKRTIKIGKFSQELLQQIQQTIDTEQRASKIRR